VPEPVPEPLTTTLSDTDAARYRGVLTASAYVSAIVDDVGTVLWISDNLTDLFGYTPDELVGTSMLDYMDLEWNTFALHSIGFALENPGQRLPMLFRFIGKDGTPVICEVIGNNQFDNPDVGGLVVNVRRWDERVMLDRVLDVLAGGEPLDDVLAELVQVMACESLESQGAVLYEEGTGRFDQSVAAPGLPAALFGSRSLLGAACYGESPWGRTIVSGAPQCVMTEDLPPRLRAAADAAGFGCCWTWPVAVRDQVGVQACLVLWRRKAAEPEPSCELVAERLVRLTGLALERARTDAQLRHAARHDVLTGLANRAQFFAGLDASLGETGRDDLVGVLYLDLDGFKPVNDTHGHRIGDLVLCAVAERLSAAVRPGDVVARLGGDEFAVLCPGVADADELASIAARLIEHIRAPLAIEGLALEVGASVGVAVAPAGALTRDALVDAADGAL
jgi:diguanylate cyclase (GGDEF)-like protein/PAS domain S-box-containing protein